MRRNKCYVTFFVSFHMLNKFSKSVHMVCKTPCVCSHRELTSSHTRDCKVWTDFGPLELVLFLKLCKDLLLCTTFIPCNNNYSLMSQRINLKMYRRHISGKTMQKVTSKFVHENIYFSGNISSKLWLFFSKMGCCQMKPFHSKITRCVRICLET